MQFLPLTWFAIQALVLIALALREQRAHHWFTPFYTAAVLLITNITIGVNMWVLTPWGKALPDELRSWIQAFAIVAVFINTLIAGACLFQFVRWILWGGPTGYTAINRLRTMKNPTVVMKPKAS